MPLHFLHLGRPRAAAAAGLIAGLVSFTPSPTHAQAHDHVGTVDFQISCAPAVSMDFDRAVAMLHHMMYEQSRAMFAQIAERDPACAMAEWGVAMTMVQPLWHNPTPEDLRRGAQAIERAQALGPRTARERALVAATAALYRDPEEGGWWPRLQRWADAMAQARRDHPDDVEIGAFYALAELAAAQAADDRMAYHGRAATALLAIHERVPAHPGAIHYTIHANDVTERASQSLDVVKSYEGIAPSVPHALHMPTHIFVRLGDWPQVIEWNRKSADAALQYPVGDRISLHYPHAMDYLLYAHLQRGDDAAAGEVLRRTLAQGPYEDGFATAFHLAAMPARYAVERRAWREAAAVEVRAPAYVAWDRFSWAEALDWFARGLGAAHTGQLVAAHEAEARMAALRDHATRADERAFAQYIEIDRRILSGFIARAEGKVDTAVARLRAAVDLERTIQKHPVTPGAVLPASEALGDLLTDLQRPREALAAYEASLQAWPARYQSLVGAVRAAQAADMPGKAQQYARQLLQVVGDAPSDREGVRMAKAVVARR